MDFSSILILPVSAVVACLTLVWAASIKRSRPRLIWPFAVSALLGMVIFVGPPEAALLIWAFTLLNVALLAAFGTVLGALTARAAIRLFRLR